MACLDIIMFAQMVLRAQTFDTRRLFDGNLLTDHGRLITAQKRQSSTAGTPPSLLNLEELFIWIS